MRNELLLADSGLLKPACYLIPSRSHGTPARPLTTESVQTDCNIVVSHVQNRCR